MDRVVPSLATVVCMLFIVYLFWTDLRRPDSPPRRYRYPWPGETVGVVLGRLTSLPLPLSILFIK
jgi:hypothetical protein